MRVSYACAAFKPCSFEMAQRLTSFSSSFSSAAAVGTSAEAAAAAGAAAAAKASGLARYSLA